MAELMKGHKWGEYKHKVVYPVVVEPKVDEIRVHVKREIGKVSFYSYAGKPLHNLDMFGKQFYDMMAEYDIFELDMGMECNGNFNDSYRWVRSSRGIPEGLHPAYCKFMLYDIPDEGFFAFHYPYTERTTHLQEMADQLRKRGIWCYSMGGVWAVDEAQVLEAYESYILRGHEGAMVKNKDHVYQRGKRSKDWLKMKPEEEADAQIIGLLEAHATTATGTHAIGDPLGRIGSLRVRLEDGSEATPAGIEHSLGTDMYNHPEKYIGQWIMFKYMERDRADGYRHPSFVRFREDKQ